MTLEQYATNIINAKAQAQSVVGITNNPMRRYGEHGKPNSFIYWDMGSYRNAHAWESHLISLGFQGATGGGELDSQFLYIY